MIYKWEKVPIKFISVVKEYVLINDNGDKKYYDTLSDIASDNNTNISNIYNIVKGKQVKNLRFTIEQQIPYEFEYDNVLYKVKSLKEIGEITGYNQQNIRQILSDFKS